MFPVTGDRYILDEILACGKLSPDEALKIEKEIREKIPEVMEHINSIEEGFLNSETKH